MRLSVILFAALAVPALPAPQVLRKSDRGVPSLLTSSGRDSLRHAGFPTTYFRAIQQAGTSRGEHASSNGSVANGDFETGLDGWVAAFVPEGGEPAQIAVDELGRAVMLERASFLTTLQQTFAIPENANELSFDLLFAPGFDLDDGFFPDAFEAQLLDEDSIPVVEPWDKRATSYFNVQEDLTTFVSPQAAYEPIIGEDGAPGYHVKLDISQVPAGIMVTLYFDLIGADADIGSGVSIDNVAVTQAGCPPDDLPCEFVVVLDADSQGEICAETVRPTINGIDCLAPMTVTARTRISGLTPKDPQADGSPGSVIITDFGAGVAPATCDGDDFISGVGPDQDEELIFEFDSSVNLKDITIRLRDIDFIFDQPVLFISDLSTPGYEYVMLEPAIQSAFTLMDFREGLILFSRFQDLPSRMVVDKFKIRETRDGFTVDLVRAIRTGCVGP